MLKFIKKILTFSLIFLLLSLPQLVLASELPSATKNYPEQHYFITQQTNYLSYEDVKFEAFKEKKEPLRAGLLNIIPLGVGSFQQEDNFAGTLLAVLDGLSLIGMIYGLIVRNLGAMTPFLLGLYGLILGRIIGFIAPYMHYNSALTEYLIKHRKAGKPSNSSDRTAYFPLFGYQIDF